MQPVEVDRNGNCLFESIAFHVLGDRHQGMHVRQTIVQYVVRNWERYQYLTMTADGAFFNTPEEYEADMSRRETCGSGSEIQAASGIFQTRFEIYRSGVVFASYGDANNPCARIMFSGDLMNGHFQPL